MNYSLQKRRTGINFFVEKYTSWGCRVYLSLNNSILVDIQKKFDYDLFKLRNTFALSTCCLLYSVDYHLNSVLQQSHSLVHVNAFMRLVLPGTESSKTSWIASLEAEFKFNNNGGLNSEIVLSGCFIPKIHRFVFALTKCNLNIKSLWILKNNFHYNNKND